MTIPPRQMRERVKTIRNVESATVTDQHLVDLREPNSAGPRSPKARSSSRMAKLRARFKQGAR
jgi:hypothetical protein